MNNNISVSFVSTAGKLQCLPQVQNSPRVLKPRPEEKSVVQFAVRHPFNAKIIGISRDELEAYWQSHADGRSAGQLIFPPLMIYKVPFLARPNIHLPVETLLTEVPSSFDVHVTVYRDTFLIINHLDALTSHIYFRNEILHVSDSSSVHHQEFFSAHTATVYVIE
jgi:hypothetical protein